MEACTYFNAAAASLLFGLLSSGACGGSAPAPSTPPAASSPSSSAATSSDPSPVAPEPVPAAATAAAAPAPAAPAASATKANDGPDRNLNDIQAIVTNNRDVFRACYDKVVKSQPGIKGTYTLKFVVNPDGTVKSAEGDSTKSEIHAPDLDKCAVAALKTLKFPPSKRGMESAVSYPFNFKPQGAPSKSGTP